MGHIIALAGKGGTGKTTLAALIVRALVEKNIGSLLAIDADPNSNLAEALGAAPGENLGAILDRVSAAPDKIPAGMTKDRFIQLQVQTAVSEENGFDLLVMGKPEGPGCYCYVNNLLRGLMHQLIDDYDYIIIDNEAGLEHLSRRTTRLADVLLVVSDASAVGLKSAKRVFELAKALKFEVKRSLLVVNRTNQPPQADKIKDTGLEYLGTLPLDTKVEELSLVGKSIFSLPAQAPVFKTINILGDRIWKRS